MFGWFDPRLLTRSRANFARLAIALLVLAAGFARAESNGITGVTSDFDNSCNGCHTDSSGNAISRDDSAVSLSGSAVSLVEGDDRNYTFTVSRTAASQRTGFSASLSNTTAASLSESSAAIILEGDEVTHASPQGNGGDTSSVSFTFNVAAAQVASNQPMTVRACGQRVNNNGSSTGDGPYGCDSISFTVTNNLAPTANAGPDQTVTEASTVTLTSAGSTDPESTTLARQWQITSNTCGSTPSLSSTTAVSPTFTAPAVTSGFCNITLTLTVTDNSGASFGKSDTDTVTIRVNALVANAGTDQQVTEGNNVSLNGTGSSDPGGGAIGYSWAQTGGPAVSLSGGSTSTPSFVAPQVATLGGSQSLTFVLTVTGAAGGTDTDTVIVVVNDIAVGNLAPVVDAGNDVTVNEGAAVGLSATATDPESGPLTYAWTQSGGTPTVTLTNPNTATPSFTAPQLASGQANADLTFTLTVTDDVGRSTSDSIIVTVNNGPSSDAGADRQVDERISVTLTGSASDATGGTVASTTWSQVSGPSVSLTNANTATASFTAPDVTTAGAVLVFRFTVRDNGPSGGLTATDDIAITIANVNRSPSASIATPNAAPENTDVQLDGTASSDPDGDTLTYAWSPLVTNAVPITLVGANTSQPSFRAPEVPRAGIRLQFQLTVQDSLGASANTTVEVAITNTNRAPVANAGADRTVAEAAVVSLSATNSTDDDDTANTLSYLWLQTGGTAVTLLGGTSATPSFTAPGVPVGGEALSFTVRVTDQEGLASEDSVIVNVSDVNRPPVANAGTDQQVNEGVAVTLTGAASADPDAPQGSIVAYSWRQTAGDAVTLTNAATATPRFRAQLVGPTGAAVEFELTVTDDAGAMATDRVIVNVTNINQPPFATAGADRTVQEDTVVTLDGSNSLDVDAPVATYRWTQLDGPPVTLSNPNAANPNFRSPLVTTATPLRFQLTVTDSEGLMASDDVMINVIDVGGIAPTAMAGDDQSVSEGANVLLDGGTSSDRDGSIASFRWRQTTGVAALLSDPNIAAPSFVAPLVGAPGAALVFELTVTDNAGLVATDTVIVNVGNVGAVPIADAGADRSAVEGSTVQLSGANSRDTAGTIVTYQWIQLAGPSVTLSNAAQVNPTFVAPAIATAQSGAQVVLQLTVTDDDGAMASDSVAVTITDNGITGFAEQIVTLRTTSNDTVGVQPLTGNLVMVQPVDPDAITDQRNRPTRLDFDLVSTNVRVPTAGATVDVVYHLDAPAPANATWVKYVPSQGWIDFGSRARFSADRRQVTVTLTDGGQGDDDGVANGVIVDPAGLGSFARDTGSAGAGTGGFDASDAGGGGRFGCTVGRDDGRIDGVLLLLGLLAMWRLWRERVRVTARVRQ